MYCVVEMEDEGGVSVDAIPEKWIIQSEGKCWWPPVKNPTKMIKQQVDADPNWQKYKCRVLKKFASYMNARQASSKAVYTSDIQSEAETPKRKRLVIPKRVPTSTDSSDEYQDSEPVSAVGQFPTLPETHNSSSADENVFELVDVLEASKSCQQPISVVNEVILGLPNDNRRIQANSSQNETEGSDVTISTLHTLVEKLVHDVALIKGTVQNNEKRLERIEKGMNAMGHVDKPGCVKLLPKRPCSTVEDFLTFDESVEEDQKDVLKFELMSCGGDTVVDFTGRVMRKLMTDEVGLKFSLWGHKGNLNFSKTRFWNSLKDSALSMKRIEATDKGIEKATSEWFRHCNDRLKQKQKKAAI